MAKRKIIPDNHLVLHVLGTDQHGLLADITKTCTECDCNIVDCKLSKLGNEFSGMFLLAGNWSAIAKMEAALPNIEQKLGLTTMIHRTSLPEANPAKEFIPFSVQATTLDRLGIIQEFSEFFNKENLNVLEMHTENFTSQKTGVKLVTLHFVILIPAQMHIAALRESFLEFCDAGNYDALMEPLKV